MNIPVQSHNVCIQIRLDILASILRSDSQVVDGCSYLGPLVCTKLACSFQYLFHLTCAPIYLVSLRNRRDIALEQTILMIRKEIYFLVEAFCF